MLKILFLSILFNPIKYIIKMAKETAIIVLIPNDKNVLNFVTYSTIKYIIKDDRHMITDAGNTTLFK